MISTRSGVLVIDTVVSLTLSKWETVSGQFGGNLTAHAAVTGETKAKRQGRPRGSKLDADESFLLALIEETDDITLIEMQDRLRAERGVSAGLGT